MASSFDEIVSRNQIPLPKLAPFSPPVEADCSAAEIDVTKRDRFELLSAYLDGEVTPAESRLVTTWLSEDPETQCLYRRLLTLRQAMRFMPAELVACSAKRPFTKSDLIPKNHQWVRKVSLAVACTVATLLAGSLTNLIGSNAKPWQLAEFPSVQLFVESSDALELALDEPAIELTAPNSELPTSN